MAFKEWTEQHQSLWEFIKFNVLSNVSTITRFVCTWAGTAVFVNALGMTGAFSFLIFDYTAAGSNGLGGFLTFLVAEVLAQVVNFFVQMKWVFKSSDDFSVAAPKFAVLAVVIVVVNLILPGYVTNFCTTVLGWGAEVSATVASVVNTLLAVIVSFPALKFWIMPDDATKARREAGRKAK
jgi:putative flippase GtrA